MNLKALFILMLVVGVTFGITPVLAHTLGWSFVPTLLALALAEFLLAIFHWKDQRTGKYPRCICGCARISNKDIVPGEVGPSWITFMCRCGRRYRLEGCRFVILNENGCTTKFKSGVICGLHGLTMIKRNKGRCWDKRRSENGERAAR